MRSVLIMASQPMEEVGALGACVWPKNGVRNRSKRNKDEYGFIKDY